MSGHLKKTPVYHLFIVYTDENGKQWIYRAGPQFGKGPPFGVLTPCTASYEKGNLCGDWDPKAPSVSVLQGEKAKDISKCLSIQSDLIHANEVGYDPFGPNSNGYVYTLLEKCGIPPQKPVNNAPGWESIHKYLNLPRPIPRNQ